MGHALNLHGVQYRIARRGAELLKNGGRLVYSTCSLNPIENEAVVSRLLRDAEGSLELVDASNLVPGLLYAPGEWYIIDNIINMLVSSHMSTVNSTSKYYFSRIIHLFESVSFIFRKGLFSWDLSDKECREFYHSFDQVPSQYHTVIRPQMFPPSKADAMRLSLDKCMRILPHFQNTGGFFVAVFTKICNLPWERQRNPKPEQTKEGYKEQASTTHIDSEIEDIKNGPPQRKKRRIFGFREDPFVFPFKEEGNSDWQKIKQFYDIDASKSNGTFDATQLLTRSLSGKKKNIYFCSKPIKELVQANEDRIKVINTGVKVFARCDHRNMKCEFRLANEGLQTLGNLIGCARRVDVSKDEFISLLEHTNPKNPLDFDALSSQTKTHMKSMDSGSVVIAFHNHNDDFTLEVVGWKGEKSLRAYIDLNDSIHLLRLLGADVTKFEVNKFTKE